MSPRLFSITLFLMAVCSFSAVVSADEAILEQELKQPPSVAVVCQGRLRYGVTAIGGETTGTTITFNRITWELQLPDDDSRGFAAQHHKAPVVVTGTLRRVAGTEDAVRWIVDVEKIFAQDSRDTPEESAKVTLRGTLRAALSQTGDVPDLSVRTDDQVWKLDFAASREMQTSAELLIGQTVLLTGSVLPLPVDSEHKPTRSPAAETHTVRVKTIEASAIAAGDARFFP